MAEKTLQNGMSVAVFPEGARTFTGHMGIFRRGAFRHGMRFATACGSYYY